MNDSSPLSGEWLKVIKAIDICIGHGCCNDCGYHSAGHYTAQNCRVQMMTDALALLKEQQRIIEQYQKADGFLFAHGWKWENHIDTQEEAHPIEVGEDGLPY